MSLLYCGRISATRTNRLWQLNVAFRYAYKLWSIHNLKRSSAALVIMYRREGVMNMLHLLYVYSSKWYWSRVIKGVQDLWMLKCCSLSALKTLGKVQSEHFKDLNDMKFWELWELMCDYTKEEISICLKSVPKAAGCSLMKSAKTLRSPPVRVKFLPC